MGEIKTKICSKCKKPKLLTDFYKDSRRKDGFYSECKKCKGKAVKVYDKTHKAGTKARKRRYAKTYKTKVTKAEANAYAALHYKTHKKEKQAYTKAHKTERNESQRKRRKNPKNKLINSMSAKIWQVLRDKKGGQHWEDVVGYTCEDLKERLKKTLPSGYTWEDYENSAKLHIDHIIPVNVFNFTTSEETDFKRCWALNNLQLLPAIENIKKSNKLDRHFQPSLTGF